MGKKIILSKENQIAIRNDIRKKIEEIHVVLQSPGVRETRDEFIEKYIICEMAYKIVLKKYLETNNMYDSDQHLNIQLQQVRAALQTAGYKPDHGLLERIFSGSKDYRKRGTKSAKILRNGIEHEMNVQDLKEVVNRKDELFKDMDSFISWIQI